MKDPHNVRLFSLSPAEDSGSDLNRLQPVVTAVIATADLQLGC